MPFLPQESRECGLPLFGGVPVWARGRGWQREHGSQRPAGVTLGASGDFLGCSGGNNLPALVACVGAEVYDPIGGFHDLQVVLDDEHRVAGVHQALEDFEQHADIVKVQAGGRFVEEEERRGGREEAQNS
jgi:hypothetical protein